MTISHRATEPSTVSAEDLKSVKVARMACCCKLADLLPVVQQLHREAARSRQRSEAA